MDRTGSRFALTDLLQKLKERSGHSYTELARRTFTSSSSLHRYCTGRSVPPDAEMVLRIAKACGANPDEQRAALQAWLATEAAGQGQDGVAVAPPVTRSAPKVAPADPGATPSVSNATKAVPDATNALVDAMRAILPLRSPAPPPRRPAVRAHARAVIFGCLLAGLAVTLSAASAVRIETANVPAAPQWVTGPNWVASPVPVQSTRFGVTMRTDTGEMPSFRVGAVRFWDSGTRWADIQPRRGEFEWATLDRLVAGANHAGLPALFVLGGTPGWAAPQAPKMPYPDGSRAAAPDRLTDWDTFVRALAGRYRGRLESYELWPIGNDPRYFAGAPATLVEMTRRAARIIKEVAPRARVVCPGMGRLWSPEGRGLMRRFADLGGYQYCDVAGIKLHQRNASDPPETMLEILQAVDHTMHESGIHPPLWSTGTTYDIVLQKPLDEEQAIDNAVRFYLTGLYGTALNLQRMYFYAWGTANVPLVLQAEEGVPTKAALAVEQLQQWLAHARIRACGRGVGLRLPANVWQCEFLLPDGSGRSHPAVIRWTHEGTAATTVPPNAHTVRRLDGTTAPIAPGDTVQVGPRPVLLEGR